MYGSEDKWIFHSTLKQRDCFKWATWYLLAANRETGRRDKKGVTDGSWAFRWRMCYTHLVKDAGFMLEQYLLPYPSEHCVGGLWLRSNLVGRRNHSLVWHCSMQHLYNNSGRVIFRDWARTPESQSLQETTPPLWASLHECYHAVALPGANHAAKILYNSIEILCSS